MTHIENIKGGTITPATLAWLQRGLARYEKGTALEVALGLTKGGAKSERNRLICEAADMMRRPGERPWSLAERIQFTLYFIYSEMDQGRSPNETNDHIAILVKAAECKCTRITSQEQLYRILTN